MSLQKLKTNVDIAEILNKYQKGSSRDYDVFVSCLNNPNVTDDELVIYFRGLRECVTLLSKEFEILVGILMKLRWFERDNRVVRDYHSLVVNLVSAHTLYLSASLHMVVRNFMPKIEKGAEVDDKTKLQHEQGFNHLHILLQALLKLVPLAPSYLIPLLSDCFPYLSISSYQQHSYVRNLLHITSYLPDQRLAILTLIVEKMTKLDVRSPKDVILAAGEDEDEEEEMDAIFDMDELSEEKTNMSMAPSSQEKEEEGPMAHPEADRLDVLMELMFHYIETVCYNDGVLNWEACKKLYRELLTVFEKVILPTHASGHIQFLIFYICSFKEPLVEGFLDYLWKKVQDPNTQPLFRQAAIAYTASLLARARYIDINIVNCCIDLLVSWIHYYIQQADSSSNSLATCHGPFYAVCQALFYVFAFRHKELLAMKNGKKYCDSLGFQQIVTSRLNPLRYCLPQVATTFASIARQHTIAFCDTVLERNRRNIIPEASSRLAQVQQTKVNPLEAFFPFDPYKLKRSFRFVQPIFKEFHGTVAEEEANHIEEELEYEEAADAVDRITCPASPDFVMYGTSPGFTSMISIG